MLESLPRALVLTYAIVVVLLIVKASVLAAATASKRASVKLFTNEEDAIWLRGKTVDSDDERVQRLFRAHRNDLESLVLFLPAGALYVVSGAATLPGLIYCAVFVLARF